MDALAKHITMEKINGENPTSNFQPTSLGYGTITYNNSLITTKLQTSLYRNILHDEMCKHLAPKLNISLDLLTSEVHWYSYKLARKESPLST